MSGLCGFLIVAIRFISVGSTLLTQTSGRCSFFPSGVVVSDVFRFVFNGEKKYFANDFSVTAFFASGLSSFDDGGDGNGNEALLCLHQKKSKVKQKKSQKQED